MSNRDAEYFIVDAFDQNTRFELSPIEYESIRKARKFLSDYVLFEENIMNFKNQMYDFEKFILDVSLDYDHLPDSDHNYFQDMRVRANGKLLSVLNAITSFRDQFPRFDDVGKSISGREAFLANWNLHRENEVHFEFCEILRNYAQHQTQPVSGVTVGGSWDAGRIARESHASVFVTVLEISSHRKVTSQQRESFVRQLGVKADVSTLLRKSADRIGDIGREMRSWLKQPFEDSCDIYQSTLDKFERNGFLYAILYYKNKNSAPTEYQIFLDFLNRAKSLRKSHLPSYTASHFISNRARGHS